MSTFQKLYDSEINFKIESFYDGGFRVSLGDEMNGWKNVGETRTFQGAENWLINQVIFYYPDSKFVKELNAT